MRKHGTTGEDLIADGRAVAFSGSRRFPSGVSIPVGCFVQRHYRKVKSVTPALANFDCREWNYGSNGAFVVLMGGRISSAVCAVGMKRTASTSNSCCQRSNITWCIPEGGI